MKNTSKEKCQRSNSWYNCLDIPRSRVQIPLLWDILSRAFLFILLKIAILSLGVMSSRGKSWANSSALIFENWIRGSKCWRIFFSISFTIIILQLRWNQKKGKKMLLKNNSLTQKSNFVSASVIKNWLKFFSSKICQIWKWSINQFHHECPPFFAFYDILKIISTCQFFAVLTLTKSFYSL